MPSPQPKIRAKKFAVVFLRTSRSIGKRLHNGFLQVRIHSKLSSSASAASDTQRTISVSPTALLPTENYHHSNMNPNDWEDDHCVQSRQMDHSENRPFPPPPPSDEIPQGPPPPPMPVGHPHDPSGVKKPYNFAEIERQYNVLVKARGDLRNYRLRIQQDRKDIGSIREQTGYKEGSVLNQLRNFLHKQSITLPREIEETLEEIEALRDQLGPMEAEYEDAERGYLLKELQYDRQESDMIDKLEDVHLHYPVQFDIQSTQANGSVLSNSFTAVTGSHEIVARNENTNAFAPEKPLQLVVQTNLSYDAQEQLQTQEIDDTYTAEVELYANRERVDSWLSDMVFQSPLQQVQRQYEEQTIEPIQISLPNQVPRDWSLIEKFGAQFQSTDLTYSPGAGKKPGVTISRPVVLSRKASACVLRAILLNGLMPPAERYLNKKFSVGMAPLWESKSTGDISLSNNQDIFGTAEMESSRPYKLRIDTRNRKRSLSWSSSTFKQLLASQ